MSRRFSEMLERAMRAYTNRSLTAAEVIAEMVEMAQQLKLEYDRGAQIGLRDDELAFYDAVCQNDSAVRELGDDTLKTIALRAGRPTGHQRRLEQEGTGPTLLPSRIRRLFVKYRYPPDKQESAIILVMDKPSDSRTR